ERADALVGAAARLTERAFAAIRFEGEGTDLTVGLLPTSKFMAAQFETVGGIRHMPNIPSEEVFSAPDPQRTDGVVRATKPLVVVGGGVGGGAWRLRGLARGVGRPARPGARGGGAGRPGSAPREPGAGRPGEAARVGRGARRRRPGTTFSNWNPLCRYARSFS